MIPSLFILNPQVLYLCRIRVVVGLNDKGVINMSPVLTPRSTPNTDLSLRNLVEGMGLKDGKHFDDGSPKGRFGSI